ncbi:XRE family transcriptional regulator [Erwinia aphidicola]|uniref:LexA family protein n=1 Tax=Erwinia aphidicola TaxID=68334 RepID=UPI0030CB5559
MKIDDNFYLRISAVRKSLGLTQDQLAEKVGVVRRQIAAYEAGDSKPRGKVLENLAHTLGATVDWLATGSGNGPDISNVRRTVTVRELPIISLASVSSYSPEDPESKMSIIGYMPSPHDAGEFSYAIQINGESMVSLSGPSFPDGTIIVVDPSASVNHGDFAVFSNIYNKEATFKQLIVDQNKEFLNPLNPSYPLLEKGDDFLTLGKVVSAQLPLLSSSKGTLQRSSEEKDDFNLGIIEIESIHSRITSLEEKVDMVLTLLTSPLNEKKPT